MQLIHWYHEFLSRPGATQMEQALQQHFTWAGLTRAVEIFVWTCDVCQHCKILMKKYVLLLLKSNEEMTET